MKSQINLRFAVAVAATVVGLARADQAAVGFDNTLIGVTWGGGTAVRGWQFSTRSTIQVSALGLWDWASLPDDLGGHVGDGLYDQHLIGIWDVSNPSTPLVSLLIPTGTDALLLDGFRYVSISPITLPVGHDYVIGDLSDGLDNVTGKLNNPAFVLTVSPEIEFGGLRVGLPSPSVLVFPNQYQPGEEAHFGPNFTYSAIPEPSTLNLCALGATAYLGLAKTLRNRLRSVRASPERLD